MSKGGKTGKGKPASKQNKPAKKAKNNNTLIIMAVVGVLLLVGVGVALFFLLSGGSTPPPPPVVNKDVAANQNANKAVDQQQSTDGSGTGGELSQKATELLEKMNTPADKDKALTDLKELVQKAGPGANALVDMLKNKAKEGSTQALEALNALGADTATSQQLKMSVAAAIKDLGDAAKTATGGTATLEEPSNLLPQNVNVICQVNVQKFLDSPYQLALFGPGAFRRSDYDRRLGMDASRIETVIIGGVKDANQVVGIIRTSSQFNWEDVSKALDIKSDTTATVKGKTYYLGKIDFMNEFIGARFPGMDALREKAAFWRKDPQTLVYGDVKTIESLLENPPEVRNTPPAEQAASTPGGEAGNAGGGGIDAPGAASSNSGARGNTPPAGGIDAPGAASSNSSGATGSGAPSSGNNPANAPKAEPNKGAYLTIDPRLKRLMSHTEDSGKPSLVLFAESASTRDPVPLKTVYHLSELPQSQAKEVEQIVIALPKNDSEPVLRIGLACKTRRDSPGVQKEVEKLLTKKGKNELKDLFGFEFKLKGGSENANQNVASGGNPLGDSGFGVGTGTSAGNNPGTGGGAGGAGGLPSKGGGVPGGGVSGPAGTGNNPTVSAVSDPSEGGEFLVERLEEYVLITMIVHNKVDTFNDNFMKPQMAYLRGAQDMASKRFRLGDLALSLESMRQAKQKEGSFTYPQGTLQRTIEADRGPRPYPAKDRISFLATLLPYLGDERYYSISNNINADRPWFDPANIGISRLLIPHFLNPNAENKFLVKVRGQDQPLAATHFVGMAGIGPDSAYLPISDKRVGMVGYDRIVRPEDVRDGTSNTIYMIEADKAQLGPWMAGGGATVRGTSLAGDDIGKRGGFSSPDYNGQKGVWVIMGDGSTRFIKSNVSPEVFKALCTINGGDTTGAVELLAPLVRLETTPRAEAPPVSASNAATKKRVVEEEEDTKPVKKD